MNRVFATVIATNKKVWVVRTISLNNGVRFKDELGNYYNVRELRF